MVTVRGAGYAETCKSGSGGGSAETAGESQYGAAVSTSHLMQMHSSYVVTDPKGTVLVECGKMLEKGGYVIKSLNTINFRKSMHYNRATCSPLKRRRTALFLISSVN